VGMEKGNGRKIVFRKYERMKGLEISTSIYGDNIKTDFM
jgi:hypothetical protein